MIKNLQVVLTGSYEIVSGKPGMAIEIQDIILNADQSRNSSVEIAFITDTAKEIIYRAELTDQPASFTVNKLDWRGWKAAGLYLISNNNADISCTVNCKHVSEALNYGAWVNFSEEFKDKIVVGGEIEVPKIQDGPEELNKLLESVYQENINENADEAKCSSIAWLAAKDAGWEQIEDKWVKKEKQADFIDVDMEIFATGKWNGREFKEKDIDEIVDSYKSIGSQVKPYLKLGHNDEQKLAKDSGLWTDGKPALGWVKTLKRQGNRLVATLRDVPKVIAELIDKKAYKRISSELFIDYVRDSKKYPLTLKAIALLGAATPAVTTLQDVLALYSEDETIPSEVFEFNAEFKKEVPEMDEKELQAKLDEQKAEMEAKFEEQIKESKEKFESEFSEKTKALEAKEQKYSDIVDMFQDVEDIKSAIESFKQKQEEVEAKEKKYTEELTKAKQEEVKKYIDIKVTENKVFPRSVSLLEKILFSVADSKEVLEFEDAEHFGLKEKMSLSDTVRAFIDSLPDMGMLKEFSSTDKTSLNVDDEREELISKYCEKHDLDKNKAKDFGEAQAAIQAIRPELFKD